MKLNEIYRIKNIFCDYENQNNYHSRIVNSMIEIIYFIIIKD